MSIYLCTQLQCTHILCAVTWVKRVYLHSFHNAIRVFWARETTVGTAEYCLYCTIIIACEIWPQWRFVVDQSYSWRNYTIYTLVLFFTTSHMRILIKYHKSRAVHLNMQWNQRLTWQSQSHYHHSTKLYRTKYHSFLAVGIVTRAAQTDSNKVVG